MGCSSCGRNLFFSERVAWPQFLCKRCAARAGIERLCDRDVYRNVRTEAERREPWWQWTIWLFWAIAWDDDTDASDPEPGPWWRYCAERRG